MSKQITMPKLGLTMKEGKVAKWYVEEGMKFKAGDPIFSVETDKLSNDVEAKEDGYMRKHIVEQGSGVPCLAPVAIVGTEDEDITEMLSNMGLSVEKAQDRDLSKGKRETRIIASPIAKKLAEEKNISLEEVKGTGPKGRITKEDIESFINNAKNVKSTPTASKIAKEHNIDLGAIIKEGRISKQDVLELVCQKPYNADEALERRIPMTTMRKVIASRMTQSWHESPAVHYNIRVDMSNIKRLKDQLESVVKVTYTDILVMITSRVLIDFPLLNSTVDGEEIILRNYINMGVAVALDEGLIVPVVKKSHHKGLKEISAEIKQLAAKAKTNELSMDEITGGTFTITNIGMFGVESFTPIINQPQVAILGITAIMDTLVPETSGFIAKPLMNLSLTADHRVVDGAIAASFLSRLKEMIEKPMLMLL